jgi:hypothetical protein
MWGFFNSPFKTFETTPLLLRRGMNSVPIKERKKGVVW